MSLEALLTRYTLAARAEGKSAKTVRAVKLAVGLFDTFLGQVDDVKKLTADDLRRFILALQQRKKWQGRAQQKEQALGATSINTYVRSIKSFFSWAAREGIIKANPLESVPAPKLPQRLPKVLTEDELKTVMRAVKDNPRDEAMVKVLLDSGMRLGELVNLKSADYDSRSGVIKVFGKGSKERLVYVSETTLLAVSLYYLERAEPAGEDWLFLTQDGRQLTGDRVEKILEGIGKKAGINQRLSPHKLRHSFATLSLRYGSNLEVLRRQLGRVNVQTTEIYLSLADADVEAAHRKFSPISNLTRAR